MARGFGMLESVISTLKKGYVVIDIETTGLDPIKNEIIEIAMNKYDNFKLVDSYHSLVCPRYVVTSKIVELTGITNRMLVDAPKIEDILDDIMSFIGDSVLVGHYVPFDISFLDAALREYGGSRLENEYVDTYGLALKLLDDMASYSLKSVASYYGISTKGMHRSAKDITVTNKILIKLLKSCS